jgi:hypothetical protein
MNDWVLFKFRKIDKYLEKSLVNSEIYFSSPEQLNDPFDCRVDIIKALKNAIYKSSSPSRERLRERLVQFRAMTPFFERVQADLEQIGVCSFSLNLTKPASSLMWAHYADNHRGICLTYRFPESFFLENADHILGIDRVDYGINPLSDWFIQNALTWPCFRDFRDFRDFGIALIKKALTVKAQPWEYEEEVRIIRQTEGVEVIDKKFLQQVCFGLKTPKGDITLIKKLIDNCGYDVALYKMVPNASNDFGLEASEIPNCNA